MCMKNHYGPWAFIAGGSEGIGAEIGAELASRGINICMVARNASALKEQQQLLQSNYGIEVIAETVDLSNPAAVTEIENLTRTLDIGFYAHVASSAPLDSYLDTSQERHHRALQVNVNLLHDLTYHFTSRMKERGSGGVILCSSMASLSPFPYNAQYSANKAYIRILGEALWFELKEFNIDVLTLIISEVSTPALLRSGSKLQGKGRTLSPSEVVEEAFTVIGKEPSLITGKKNRITAYIAQYLIPKKKMMKILARQITRYKEPPDVH
jgi:short-subunit dehydrogenase